MNTKKQFLHDSTLVVRLPKALHEQLEVVATAQYMKMGELVRQLIKTHIAQSQTFLNVPNQPAKTPVSVLKTKPYNALSPAERAQIDAEWEY